MNTLPVLTLLTLIPLAGALAVALVPTGQPRLARNLALGFAGAALALASALWLGFDPRSGGFQFIERHAWIPSMGVDYHTGVDGLGLLMVWLAAWVIPPAVAVSSMTGQRPPAYYALVLALQAGLFGVFTALNFFHWFLYWELSLIPAYFLIKLWGGSQRQAAATQFFLYTMAGSVTLLLAFLGLYAATGVFDLPLLAEMARTGALKAAVAARLGGTGLAPGTLMTILFIGAFLGFAVKTPLVPFHAWLPHAYAEAPGGVTMILTGVLSKMGIYGFLRLLLPVFPEQVRAAQVPLLCLAVLTIIYGASAACAQKDIKRMLACSSISHLGFCALALFAIMGSAPATPALAKEQAWALHGTLLQLLNHGVTASTLFCFAALLEARGEGLRGLDDFGGLRQAAPVFCGLAGIAVFASLGLPGLNGFAGEFLILKGVFAITAWPVVLSLYGLLATAVFYLAFMHRVFFGPLPERWKAFPDLSPAERWLVAPATLLMFLTGLWPALVTGPLNATVLRILRQLS